MLGDNERATYEFSKKLQGPVMDMMLRGSKIDYEGIELVLHGDPTPPSTRNERLGLYGRLAFLGGMEKDETRRTNKWQVTGEGALLQELAMAISGKSLNYHSPKQLQALLYGDLRLPEQTEKIKGRVKVCTNREALEHLIQNYPRSVMICSIILKLRSLEKLVEILTKKIDSDGRMRCSFNIAGTETGRFSSSTSVWDTGMNLQNVTPELRRIFVPDKGFVLWNADLEQAESRAVAYLANDESYIKACEGSDLHTTVASMLFGIPDDKDRARIIYYRHFSYRDMSKRAGHAINYILSAHALARHMKISVKQAWKVHMLYLGGHMLAHKAAELELYSLEHDRDGRFVVFPGAFPGIKRWHDSTKVDLELNNYLITPEIPDVTKGRKRWFWGHINDAATLREAVAYKPQSLISEILNEGMYQIWTQLPEAQLLNQVHDSIGGQCLEKDVDKVREGVLELLRLEIPIGDRVMVIPAAIKFGMNGKDLQ